MSQHTGGEDNTTRASNRTVRAPAAAAAVDSVVPAVEEDWVDSVAGSEDSAAGSAAVGSGMVGEGSADSEVDSVDSEVVKEAWAMVAAEAEEADSEEEFQKLAEARGRCRMSESLSSSRY